MNIVVSSIVEVSVNKVPLKIRVSADDWTSERAIIASNDYFTRFNLIWQNFTVPDISHF